MDKLGNNVYEMCELKEKLLCAAREELSKGVQNVNTHEMGEVVDMIKDLAEAEEKCWKARYYESIVNAMEKESEEMERMGYSKGFHRMGYDNWRYSSGRFAPTGRGHYDPSGYTPMHDMNPQMITEEYDDPWNQMRGYSGNGGSSRTTNGSAGNSNRMGYSGSQRGDRYDRYNKARMGYHESKDAATKEHMDSTAREYVVDVAESMREIWREADPAMRKEIKNKLVALTGEMN